jgi:predicted RNase H-like HicB family nuclease
MLTYKAMYKFVDGGVHAEVLDFPGAITFGHDLDDARQRLANALVDMAETHLLAHEPLPSPDSSVSDAESDLEEPIHLLLTAAARVTLVPGQPSATSQTVTS